MSAQNKIDFNMLNLFKNNLIEQGIFVEAGGSHPVDQNNTLLLEQNGWTGLVVEPKKDFNHLYSTMRPKTILENYVLVDFNYNSNKIKGDFRHYMMGGIINTFNMSDWQEDEHDCCTLQSLLDKHGLSEIHFLSLDTEGSEEGILKGIDFKKTFIHMIVMECHGETTTFKWLENLNYTLIRKHKQHEYYVNKNSKLYLTYNKFNFEE